MSLVFIAEFLSLGQVQTQRRKLRGRLPPEKKFYMKFWKWVGNEESERRLVKRQLVVQCMPLDLALNHSVFGPRMNPTTRLNHTD